MHILETIIRMETALKAMDAPTRQTTGVAAWTADIAEAVVAGNACGSTIGTHADPAWRGHISHRGFVATCRTIIDALRRQQAAAETIRRAAESDAASADGDDRDAALAQARRAETWRDKAAVAASAGISLLDREDALLRPVGVAVHRAGGITEVARDKHYHQGRGPR